MRVSQCLVLLLLWQSSAAYPIMGSEPSEDGIEEDPKAHLQQLDEQRRAGVLRAEREDGDDPLAWDAPERATVARVCSTAPRSGQSVGVPSEWAMCVRRGRRLVQEMSKWKDTFSQVDVARLAGLFERDERRAYGVWVRIEQGVAVDYEVIGPWQWQQGRLQMHLAFVSLCQRLGAFGNATFEYITTIMDGCENDPLLLQQVPPQRYYEYLPVLSYSRDVRFCPHHILVPTVPWIHAYPKPPEVAWEKLHARAVFGGSYFNVKRFHAAALGQVGALKGNDIQVRCPRRTYCVDDVLRYKKKGWLPDATDLSICDKTGPGTMCMNNPFEQTGYKYLLAIDGVGAVDRFQEFFAYSGVAIDVGTDYEQYYSDDIIPFVHYANCSSDPRKLEHSLSKVLEWLKQNDAAAHEMSNTAQKYMIHMGTQAKARYFQLFAALFADKWQDKPRESHHTLGVGRGRINCGSLKNHFVGMQYDKWGEWYTLACEGDVVPLDVASVKSTAVASEEGLPLVDNNLKAVLYPPKVQHEQVTQEVVQAKVQPPKDQGPKTRGRVFTQGNSMWVVVQKLALLSILAVVLSRLNAYQRNIVLGGVFTALCVVYVFMLTLPDGDT